MQSSAEVRSNYRDATRERIVDSAVELVLRDGIAGVPMSKLAARARVSRPTLYTHFPTLEHVLAAWFDREVAEFHGALEGRLAETDDPLKRLTVYLTAQCRVFAGDGLAEAVGLPMAAGPAGPVLSDALERHLDGFRALVGEFLADAVEQGRVTEEFDATLLASLVVAMVDGVRPAVASGVLDPRAASNMVMRVLLSGVGRS